MYIISHISGTYPDFQFWSNIRTCFFHKILFKNSTDLVRDFRQQLSIFGAASILKSNYSWCLAWLQLWHPSNRSVWLVITSRLLFIVFHGKATSSLVLICVICYIGQQLTSIGNTNYLILLLKLKLQCASQSEQKPMQCGFLLWKDTHTVVHCNYNST